MAIPLSILLISSVTGTAATSVLGARNAAVKRFARVSSRRRGLALSVRFPSPLLAFDVAERGLLHIVDIGGRFRHRFQPFLVEQAALHRFSPRIVPLLQIAADAFMVSSKGFVCAVRDAFGHDARTEHAEQAVADADAVVEKGQRLAGLQSFQPTGRRGTVPRPSD